MDEALKSAGLIILGIIGVAYFTFVTSDAVFNPKEASSTPIIIRDILGKEQHHLYGHIVVPSTCDEVREKTVKIDESHYELTFTTWREPEALCIDGPAERTFDTIIFAPSVGVKFTALLDGEPIPIAVFPVISY